MESILSDIRHGIKLLVKRPGFTLVAVGTLALAIGANTAIFSILNAVLLHPYAHLDTDHWGYLWERPNIEGLSQIDVSPGNFRDWKDQATSFSDMAMWLDWGYTVTSGTGDAERVTAAIITPDFFEGTGLIPAAGRLLEPADYNGDGRTVVISYGLWQRRFGGDPDLPGKKIELNLAPHLVVGVAPRDFSFPVESRVDVWTAMPTSMLQNGTRDARGYRAAARLKPGVNFTAAQSEMNLIAERLAQTYPEDKGYGVVLVPMRETVAGTFRTPLLALFGALGLVLLLACVNIANLQLVRLEARRKELALRTALGAGRARLIRQLLIESLVLSVAAGALGVLLAPTAVKLLLSLVPPDQAPWLTVTNDRMVLGVSAGLTLLTALLAGLLPALRASGFDLKTALSSGGPSTGGAGINRRLRRGMLIAQLALALAPLAGTGLLVQTFLKMANVDPGFKPRNRLTLSFSAPGLRYGTPEKIQTLAQRVSEEVGALAGIKHAGLVQFLPFSPAAGWLQAITREDPKGIQNPADLPHVRYTVATPGYVEAMGIALKRGRTFSAADTKDSMPVAVISEALAQKYFDGEDPIGKQIWAGHAQLLPKLAPRTIVGVIGDSIARSLDTPAQPAILVPVSQQGFGESIWRSLYLVVESDLDTAATLAAVREQVGQIDGQLALTDIASMESRLGNSLWRQRFMAVMVTALGLSAVAIAMLGVFGITSYVVGQRTREIGVRVALGANGSDIFRLIMMEGFWFTIAGIGLGTLCALGLARFISGLLFGVGAADPLTYGVVALTLGVLAMLACYVPARRAARVNPTVALRYE